LKKFLTIFLVSWSYTILSAQVVIDSSKNTPISPLAEYCREKDFSPNRALYTAIDTSMEGVQKYFPNNFQYGLGLSNRKLFFEPSTELGFRSGFDNLNLFGYNEKEIKYYKARTPYTEIFAVFGMKKEQYSRILHTQNITKQWNIALNMLRIRCEGFYQRQNCTNNNISLSTNYTSKNNRYSVLSNGIISSIKSDENGGLADSLTEIPLGNKKLVPVELMDARTKRLHREIYIKQSVYFGKKENVLKGDSIIGKKIKPTTSISYSFNASDDMFAYTESKLDSNYYKNIFFDSVQTLDSTHIEQFVNEFGFQTTLFKRVKVNLGMDQKNTRRIVQYSADSMRTLLTGFYDETFIIGIGSAARKDKSKGFFWNIKKHYIVNGDHQGDNYTSGKLGWEFNKGKKISLEINHTYHSAPFLYSYYNSNHFCWENSFDKITENIQRLSYKDPAHKFLISAEMNTVINYVYFDTTFSPVVFKGYDFITLYNVSLDKNFHLKHFGFNNDIRWQQVSEDVIHLPKFVTHQSLYYQGKWFKKVTDVQIGFDVTYFSAYYADKYMPALGLYYVQYEKKIGNYPFMDFFFNMKIKRAMIFFKSEHVNAGLMGQNYFVAPHMPAPDRSIKVGVRWVFYD
jgi:hypothetical protein